MKLKVLLTGALLTALSLTAEAQQVKLIHAINGGDLGLDPALPVDIRIGRHCVASNVTFRTISPYFHQRAGAFIVRVSLANPHRPCRGQRVISELVEVNFGDSLSLVAHQTDDGGIRLTRFSDEQRSQGQSNGLATVRHTADAPTVDIQVNGGVAIPGISNGDSAKAVLPAATYSVGIAPAGAPQPVFGPVDLPIPAQTNTVVYAVGSLTTGSFEVLVDSIALH
ncbi:MAG: DUF4397 domain-containing protein [Pseudomonadota bacterium]